MSGLRLAREGLRFLGHSKRRTALMLLGPLVGVTALVAVVASARGTSAMIQKRLSVFGDRSVMIFAGSFANVHGGHGERATTLKLDDIEAIRQVPGVVTVAPAVRQRDVDISYQGQAATTIVMGVTEDFPTAWDWPVASGTAIDAGDVRGMRPVCLLGRTVARELFGDASPIGQSIQIGTKRYEVKGVLSVKGTNPRGGDMDDVVQAPLSTVMRRMLNQDYVNMARARLASPALMAPVKQAIVALLEKRHSIVPPQPDDFGVVTPDMAAHFMQQASGTLGLLLLVLAGISLLAGGIVVMNVMVVSVRERRKEIGLRRAVGATRGDIRTQFLCESAAVTLLGGVLGAALGTGVALVLQIVVHIPMLLTWEPYALAVACSLVVGLLFGAYPARSAARLAPVDALRG